MVVRTEKITVTASGSAGSATGSTATDVINGRILSVHLDYSADAPATTDVDLIANNGKDLTVLNIDNANTDSWFHPRLNVEQNEGTGAAAGDNLWDKFPVNGTLTLDVAGCDPDETVTALVLYEFGGQ